MQNTTLTCVIYEGDRYGSGYETTHEICFDDTASFCRVDVLSDIMGGRGHEGRRQGYPRRARISWTVGMYAFIRGDLQKRRKFYTLTSVGKHIVR